ncbi:MAG: DUF4292 domain-containing protein [Brumimicrobium sp.]|nr:DUF4292 domain-containing protein [Brumimicrobium sp.]MCO5267431.1 DUF4292 domain-containing protein [Brumimicrobium sp.]
MKNYMIRYMLNKHFSLLLFALLLVSCGSNKLVQEETKDHLPKIQDSVILTKLQNLASKRPLYFSTKLSTRYKDKDQDISFKTSVKMKTDSALQATVTFANIPIYNTVITPDTLTLVDKRKNCYMKETMDFFKRQFNVNFKHSNIEEIILGMPIDWDNSKDYYLVNDPYNYVVSTSDLSIKEALKKEDLVIRYYLDKEISRLERTVIESPRDTSTIEIKYGNRMQMQGFDIPEQGEITIRTPRGETFIEFKYGKSSINEPVTLFLVIPEKYERCQ